MLKNLSGETRLFPILGDPLIFVKSLQRLTTGFEARGHNGVCIPTQVVTAVIEHVMSGLASTSNVDGLFIQAIQIASDRFHDIRQVTIDDPGEGLYRFITHRPPLGVMQYPNLRLGFRHLGERNRSWSSTAITIFTSIDP